MLVPVTGKCLLGSVEGDGSWFFITVDGKTST